MKITLFLFAVLVCFAGKAKAQSEIAHFAADPPTCDPTRGMLYYNTTSQVVKSCTAVNTWTAIGAGTIPEGTIISPLAYGYIPDVKGCFGKQQTVSITSGVATITCTPGPFLPSDTGKEVWATGGCCINTLYGAVAVLNTATLTYVNSTTITVSPNPIASCTTTCILVWGTPAPTNDAALSAAEAAFNLTSTPANLHLPSGWAFVRKGHFHTTAPNMSGSGGAFVNIGTGLIEYGGGVISGEGNAVSMLIPDPSFDFTHGSAANSCGGGTSAVSCFGGGGATPFQVWHDWGINALHISLTGGNNAVNLVNTPDNGKILNWSATDWGDADAAALGVLMSGGNMTLSNVDSFGGTGGTLNINGLTWLVQNFIGESNGFSMRIAAGPLDSYSNYFGQTNSGSPVISMTATGILNAWTSRSDYVYTNTPNVNSNILISANGFAYIDRMENTNNGTGAFNALYCPGSCFVSNSHMQGGSTGSTWVTNGGASGGTIFNLGHNILAGTISSSVIPTIASSAGTSSAVVDANSFNEYGSFTLTGSATAAATTVTLTFAGTFAVNAVAPTCNLTLKNGTGTWNARASIIEGTTTTTSYQWLLDNNAVNLPASTFRGVWSCTPR